jgi:alpha/beta superfamily hydrolase
MGSGVTIQSAGPKLKGYVSRPPASSAAGAARPGLVICHGFPATAESAKGDDGSFPKLADRIGGSTGWTVLTFNFRGTGRSEGDFSLGGWLADIGGAIDYMLEVEQVSGVWLAGFSTGGSLAICTAGEDERVRGVAALGAPADFHHWSDEPERFLEHARAVGVIHTPGYPSDPASWARELQEIRPMGLIGKIPPRSVLIVHGVDDRMVSPVDARVLADAAEEAVELRLIPGAGNALRHDPRAIAVLLGWLDRQHVTP